MRSSALALLALHGLRLKGFASTPDLAALVNADQRALDAELASLQDAGLVTRRRAFTGAGNWQLTADGRAENERLLADELDGLDDVGGRAMVVAAYERFRQLNTRLLSVCSRWQVKPTASGQKLNDHSDPAYDRAVLDDLAALDADAGPVCGQLTSVLDRFASYRPRLADALAKVLDGDYDWLTKPLLASYHTVWFELHEDLLVTLGLDRASELDRTSAALPAEPIYDRC